MKPDPDNVGEYLISARSYDEYRAMFALADNDMAGSILDCPGGGSSFTAQTNANGVSAVAVDPVYGLDHEWLAEHFARDLIAHPDRYVTGSLPELPFEDEEFDLVLSSHLLFTYADRLDAEFHRNALRELYRVCRNEVRVFPLLEQGGRPVPALLQEVQDLGIPCSIRRVEYEFQRGGNEMLVLTK